VCGVTLRLLVIGLHFVVVSRHQQTTPLTSDYIVSSTRYNPSQLSELHLAFTSRDEANYIGSESQVLHTTAAFDAPVEGGGPSKYCHDVWHGKLEWCGYPTVKKIDDMFIRFDRIRKRDRQTDRHTDGHRMTA